MPTPIGHALAGITVGCLVLAGRAPRASGRVRRDWIRPVALVAMLGAAPDLDFLAGVHSAYTHSLGAMLVVGLAAAALITTHRIIAAVAASVAYGSHIALDWLGTDTVAPYGIMALWPLSSDYFLSDRFVFLAICREYRLGECWLHNGSALLRELVFLTPPALLAISLLRRRR
jgi:membrane-bound metal-dependent hydrolase YbcI (DUF457 family)